MGKVYVNGKLLDKADARISVYDHGLLYGDGVSVGVPLFDGRPFRLNRHLDILYASARYIALEIPLTPEQLAEAVLHTVQANGKQDGHIVVAATRGAGGLGLDPRKTTDPQIVIIVDEIHLFPPELCDGGLHVVTSSLRRNNPDTVGPFIHSLSNVHNVLAKIEAVRAGCFDAILLDGAGDVSGCTAGDVFLVQGGVLRTPPIPGGVAGECVIELAKAAGLAVQEAGFTRHDVYCSEECFLTAAGADIVPVVTCDGRPIGDGKPGPVTRRLRAAFHRALRQ